MTQKRKIFLLSAICILVAGFLISFKSHQLNNEVRLDSQEKQSAEVVRWAQQTLLQKITQLESSVSYLDPSTIETLKRMGARYFAYAFESGGQWKVKWKVLDKMDRKAIVTEVNQISFEKMSSSKRAWTFNKTKDSILISPVQVAGSNQLKTGFLVFGLDDSFFTELKSMDSGLSLVAANEQKIFSSSQDLKVDGLSLFDEERIGVSKAIGSGDQARVISSFFSQDSQTWMIRSQSIVAQSYLASMSFLYFLLAFVLSMGFLAIIINRFMESSVGATKSKDVQSVLSAVLFRSRQSIGTLAAMVGNQSGEAEQAQTWFENDTVDKPEVIEDFSSWLDSILEEERVGASTLGIEIKTLVEESASLVCETNHLGDFIKRLIANSKEVLADQEDKSIQIQLVEQGSSYQFIYLDTRTSEYPSGAKPSLLLQSQSSLEKIDGIVSYGHWLFGEELRVAKNGFCLSVDLAREVSVPVVKKESVVAKAVEVGTIPFDLQELDEGRIEIDEADNLDLSSVGTSFEKPETITVEEEIIEEAVESFEMKALNFQNTSLSDLNFDEPADIEPPVEDSNGIYELNAGNIKIKIRSPKKRDENVDY